MADDQIEFTSEDDVEISSVELNQFNQAVLWGTDWTVETIIAQLRRGNIEINPRFQRRDAWSRPTKSRFIESVILGLPVPQIVLAELHDQRGRFVILDGKQRLLSLLQFAGLGEGNNNAFRLSGLEVRTDLQRRGYKNLETNPELKKDFDSFLTHTIRAVVIRNWPSISFLHIVFQRLNTGSLKLSPQELRQALAPGDFTNFADDATIGSTEIQRLLGRETPDPRMRDVELLVRFISFQQFLPDYFGRMKDFLDNTCIDINKDWTNKQQAIQSLTDKFKAAITTLEAVFGDKLARKKGSKLFNRSIFDALSYFAANDEVRALMAEKPAAVRAAYETLIENEKFQEAIESDTAGLPHTAARFALWGEALQKALDTPLRIPRLVPQPAGEQRFAI